jgi:hypothetical protein
MTLALSGIAVAAMPTENKDEVPDHYEVPR